MGSLAVLNATDVFGADVWFTNPTGTGPAGDFRFVDIADWATLATANKVASIIGGSVVQSDPYAGAPTGKINQPMYKVQLADGTLINAGEVAAYFTHGMSLDDVATAIVAEIINQTREQTGQVRIPSTVHLNMPVVAPPPTPGPVQAGSFGREVKDKDGNSLSPRQWLMMFPWYDTSAQQQKRAAAMVAAFDGADGTSNDGVACTGSCQLTAPDFVPRQPTGLWTANS
jgi:hypothetical protein